MFAFRRSTARPRKSPSCPGPYRKPTPRPRFKPAVEILEDRLAPAVITVTTVADDLTPNDGTVSLREAITAINAGNSLGDPDITAQNPGTFGTNDTINFNISAAGTVQTINVGSTGLGALPAITQLMTINGYSEPGASVNTLANGDNAKILIELNGANAGANADGLLIQALSTVEGLAINRFSLNGIELQGASFIQGNFIGTNPQGTAAEPNQNDGIRLTNTILATIGGTAPAARNVVSGNQIDGIHIVSTSAGLGANNVIEGNFVGVNAAGTGSVGIKSSGGAAGTLVGNNLFGIEISGGANNTVGGATAGARNVVGFNAAGIEVDDGGQNNIIQGNFSGVGADGVTPVGNNLHGIVLRSDDNLSPPLGPGNANEAAVSGNVIGLDPNTSFSGLGNLVEFNGTGGIAVFGNPLPNNATPIQNTGNSILGNSVFENARSNPTALLGIDLTNGFVFPKDDGFTPNDSKGHGAANDPNNFQNFPILSSAVLIAGGVQITGTFTEAAEPNTTLRLEFFANNPDPLGGIAEGQIFLGAINVTTGAGGSASFSQTLNVSVSGGQLITATATNLTADPSAQAGNTFTKFDTSEFSPAVSANQAPAITSANQTTFTVGMSGTFTVTTTGFPAPSLSETGPLPGGVGFTDNHNGTATLAGTPAAGSGGTYPLTLTAHNGVGTDATQNFTLTVNEAPAITSPAGTSFVIGTAASFTVTATGFPAPSLSESGALPSGVTFNPATGVLGGTPAAGSAGTYPITFTAHNGVGGDATQTFTLRVLPVPTQVYVNPAFTGPAGTDPDGAGPATAIGYDAFPTIGQGLDAVATGGTVNVAAATYTESLTLTRPVIVLGAGSATTTLSGPNAGTGLNLTTAGGAAVSGLTVRDFGTGLVAGASTTFLALTDVRFTGNGLGASVNGVATFLVAGGSGDDTFFVNPTALAHQGDNPVFYSGVTNLTVDGGGGTNRLVVFLNDISTADTVWFGAGGIARDTAKFRLFYRDAGGSFGGGVEVVLGGGPETVNVQGQLTGAPTTIYGEGGNDVFNVAVTANSAYAGLTLDGGGGSDTVNVFDQSGGAFIQNVPFPGGGIGQFDVFYPGGAASVIRYQNVELTQDNAAV